MSIIFLGIAGYLGSILYQNSIAEDSFLPVVGGQSTISIFTYPDRIEIQSADGREVMVTLLGRSAKHIQFARSDGQEFVYAIASLGAKSKELVSKYPNLGIKNSHEYMAKGEMSLGDLHIQQLQQVIRNIEEELVRYSAEHEVSMSKVERRTIERKMQDLMLERVEIQRQISERQ